MTSEVAPQAIKRRKMGFNVDFLDDSGYPMDGVELDSSSSATAPASTTANNRGQQLEQTSTHHNNNNITTSSSTISSNQQDGRPLQQSNNIASTTNNSAPTNSSENQQQGQQPQQQQQLQQPGQERPTPAIDEKEADAPIDVMTMNEAMTTDDSPPAAASHNNDELKFSLNSDTHDFGLGNASAATAISSLFRMGNQATASTPHQNSNHSATNNSSSGSGAHSLPKLRSFGDLFDDDDLD